MWWLRLGFHLETHAQIALSNTHFESQYLYYQNELEELLAKLKKTNETIPKQKEFQNYEKFIRLHKFYFAGANEALSEDQIITLLIIFA